MSNKLKLLLFIFGLLFSFESSVWAILKQQTNLNPNQSDAKKIEIDDPLLEDDLFQDSVSEEMDKTKIQNNELGIQKNSSSQDSKKNKNNNYGKGEEEGVESSNLNKEGGMPGQFTLENEVENKPGSEVGKALENELRTQVENEKVESLRPKTTPKRWSGKDPRKGFIESDEENAYYYKEADNGTGVREYKEDLIVKPKAHNYNKGLISVSKDGSYRYKLDESEISGSSSLRFGTIPPLSIENSKRITYEDVYGDQPITVFLFDYDWLTFKSFGHWVLSLGSGLGLKDGQGIFIDDRTEAEEVYSLYIILNHISFIYRFQYTKKPWFVPYISIGALPTILFERRDDDKRNVIAFSPSVQGSGGVRFNVGRLDEDGSGNLDAEYGINNLWLDVEYRRIQSFSKETDISSNLFNIGMGFDF